MAAPGHSLRQAPSARAIDVELASLGELVPASRRGGQGRVYAPSRAHELASTPLVVKLYRTPLASDASDVLADMVAWGRALPADDCRALYRITAWPLAIVSSGGCVVGMLMEDLRARFELPFAMPSGRVANVMLQLEHFLGPDDYLQQRGHARRLDTRTRAAVAERVCAAFAFLHRHGVVGGDVSPSNVLIALDPAPRATLIDCDSMALRGRRALPAVETADWQVPASFGEPALSFASDSYKLGLVVLRLFARSSDARSLHADAAHVPGGLHGLLTRALSADAAGRPSAPELERALRRVLADEHLARRYPGPPSPARARTRSHTAPARDRRVLPSAGPSAARTRAGGEIRHHGGRPTRAGPAQLRAFTGAWLIVGVLALFLLLHLLQSAAISQSAQPGYPSRPASEFRRIAPAEEQRRTERLQLEEGAQEAPGR